MNRNIINKRYSVLDKGFLELQDVMGDDLAIVNAARVSYLGESKGEEKDKQLLFYLIKNNHSSVLEMVEFKFRVKCPLPVARQWMRHRTFSYNEVSRRYTDENIEFYIPDQWRQQSENNKQSSTNEIVNGNHSGTLRDYIAVGLALYNKALDDGIAKEQARIFLPQAMYTEFIAKVDANNLIKFLRLRLDSHAQYEIRLYAICMLNILKQVLPWTVEALVKYDPVFAKYSDVL